MPDKDSRILTVANLLLAILRRNRGKTNSRHVRVAIEAIQMLQQTVPRIESLRVKNYRSLRDVQLRKITPLSVFLGPNGSGKSTLLDVFAFLSE